MSLFDVLAGLTLVVSGLVGWVRGGVREVAGVAALAVAAVLAIFALRVTGPIARHAIHTAWLANMVAILAVMVAIYVVLRVIASAISRGVRRTAGLGSVDRMVGGGIGLARALIVLGIANLSLTALTPPDRMPGWVTSAYLYPVSGAAAAGLKAFAPKGAALAGKLAPAVGNAITSDNPPATDPSDSGAKSLRVEVEKAR